MKKSIVIIAVIVILFSGLLYRNYRAHNEEIILKHYLKSSLEVDSDSVIVDYIEIVKTEKFREILGHAKSEYESCKWILNSSAESRMEEMFNSVDLIVEASSTWESMTTKEKSKYLLELDGIKVYLCIE